MLQVSVPPTETPKTPSCSLSTSGRVSRKVSPRRAARVQWYHGLCRGVGFIDSPPPTFIMSAGTLPQRVYRSRL